MSSLVLTTSEATDLRSHEQVIERGLGTFVEVGNALLAIRDGRLYRETHGTFEDYCRERWGMSKTHANRLIEAAEVSENVTPIGVIPTSESQARPLARLEPPQQQEAWRRAVESAPNGKPTARHVEEAAEAVAPRREPPRSIPVHAELFVEDDEPEPIRPNPTLTPDPPRKPLPNQSEFVLATPEPRPEPEDISSRWNKVFHNLFMETNSIRDLGGIRKLAEPWSPSQRERAANALRRHRDLIDSYISELEDMNS